MHNRNKTLIAAGCLMALAGSANAQSEWLKGSPEEQIKTLAELQPGLGTVMIEYSFRFGAMYYAAQGGNWKLAEYQLKEMIEIQEVAEHTRPGRAQALKQYEEKSLAPIGDAIKQQNLKAFNVAFQAGLKGCNECHVDQKFGFVHYVLPKSSPSPLSSKP
jgi:hypothetical protein